MLLDQGCDSQGLKAAAKTRRFPAFETVAGINALCVDAIEIHEGQDVAEIGARAAERIWRGAHLAWERFTAP